MIIILLIILIIIILIILLLNIDNINNFNNTNIKVSVIVLNYNRPHNIKTLIPKLIKYKNIGEIIISHGKSDTEILIEHPKVINETLIRNKYYSMARFYLAKQAKYDLILYLDDDILIYEEGLNELIDNAVKYGYNNLYGNFKRYCSVNGYSGNEQKEEDLISLTKLALISKETSLKVLDLMEKNINIYNMVMENKGNGEDILFSKTLSNNKLGINKYVYVNYKDLDGDNGYSSNNDHYIKRGELCKLISKN